jgi:hypothetical protein
VGCAAALALGADPALKHECRPDWLTGTVKEGSMRYHRKLRLRIIVIGLLLVKIRITMHR